MSRIKKWINRVGNWVLNTILNFYLKNITSLSILYTLIFSVSWLLCYYKFNNLQLEIINMNLKEHENNIIFNKKILSINNCIRDATLVDLKECEPPENVIINIKENCITNKKIDIDKLFILTNEKKSLNTMLAIEESDFSLWQKFINENRNKIKNSISIKNEESFLKNTIENNNNNITILKKTKIKLLFGLGLLIASDLLLKTIFC